jgi:hypothetical protein
MVRYVSRKRNRSLGDAIGLIGATMFFRRGRLILDSPFASVMRLPIIDEPGLSL